MKQRLLLLGIVFLSAFVSRGQCANPTTIFLEDFEGPSPIIGAITTNIYGGGSWNNASYLISGVSHGWFNVINGLGNVDVYDRQINGLCPGQDVEVSFWTRQSFGVTNVTYSVIDDANSVLATSTITLTNTFQQITYNFIATTPGIRFVIHCNSVGGSGVDIVVEDILVTQCVTDPTENISYTECSSTIPVDLFGLFSSSIPAGGTWSGPSLLANGDLGTFDPALNANGIYSYSVASVCGLSVSTIDVNFLGSFSLGNDTLVCAGTNVLIDAGAGYDFYNWSTGPTTQSITVNTPGTYSVEVGTLMSNVIQNGDFEGGTTAAANNFTTAYIPGTGGSWGLLSTGGQYAIATSPSLTHTNFVFCADHTSGSGNMLVANGAWTAGTVVWSQTVPISVNTDYLFSFWATNVVNNPNTSDLQLYVNGIPIGPVNATTTSCNWLQISDVWNSGANTSATLEIVNQSTAASGNDFAIDDISFAPICVAQDTIVITHEVPIQNTMVIDPVCVGQANGEIHVTNALAIEYSMDNGTTWQVDSFFVGLPAGNYSICSRSALGCVICENVVVTDPAPVTITVGADSTICQNGSANLVATANGGTAFDYHWDFTNALANTQVVSPTTTTSYTVYAENELGCISPTETITITVNPTLSGTISPTVTICPGFSATPFATASGGNGGPYTFAWSSGPINVDPTDDAITVAPQTTTTYTVTISDACETTPITLSTEVIVAPVPEPSYQILSEAQCEPGIFQVMNTTDPNLSASIVWVVNGEEVFVDQEIITTQAYNAGSYDLEMTVTSFDGCITYLLFEDALVVAPSPTAGFTFSPSPPTMFNTQVLFNNSSTGATTYEWTFESGAPAGSTVENPSTVFPDGQIGTYEVQLIAISDLGCTDTALLDVQVYPEVILYAPNTFTPDGDEFNQDWRVFIEGVDIYDFQLTIYNRWGEAIWETQDPEQGWDGNYNGRPVPIGTYSWFIRTRDLLNDDKYEFEGHVNVIK